MKYIKTFGLSLLFVLLMSTCAFAKTNKVTVRQNKTYQLSTTSGSAMTITFKAKTVGVYSFEFSNLTTDNSKNKLKINDGKSNFTLLDKEYYNTLLNDYMEEGYTFTDSVNLIEQEEEANALDFAYCRYTVRYNLLKGMKVKIKIKDVPNSSFKLKVTRGD